MLVHSYRSFQFSPEKNLLPSKKTKKNALPPQKIIDGKKLSDVNKLRAAIMEEMISIDKQMHKVTNSHADADFSMRQTWREMIEARRHLLRQLTMSIA